MSMDAKCEVVTICESMRFENEMYKNYGFTEKSINMELNSCEVIKYEE